MQILLSNLFLNSQSWAQRLVFSNIEKETAKSPVGLHKNIDYKAFDKKVSLMHFLALITMMLVTAIDVD